MVGGTYLRLLQHLWTWLLLLLLQLLLLRNSTRLLLLQLLLLLLRNSTRLLLLLLRDFTGLLLLLLRNPTGLLLLLIVGGRRCPDGHLDGSSLVQWRGVGSCRILLLKMLELVPPMLISQGRLLRQRHRFLLRLDLVVVAVVAWPSGRPARDLSPRNPGFSASASSSPSEMGGHRRRLCLLAPREKSWTSRDDLIYLIAKLMGLFLTR